jgi:hypothetical protein
MSHLAITRLLHDRIETQRPQSPRPEDMVARASRATSYPLAQGKHEKRFENDEVRGGDESDEEGLGSIQRCTFGHIARLI